MKRNIIFAAVLFFITSSLFAQQGKLEFVQKKLASDGFTVYFEVVNILDDTHAQTILAELTNDNNIFNGRYFKSSLGKDRFQIYINDIVTAEYVRNILFSQNVDFEFTCVSIDGVLINGDAISTSTAINGSAKSYITSQGFPKYERTGEKEDDDANYKQAKDEWINENPEEYNKLLIELEEDSKIE